MERIIEFQKWLDNCIRDAEKKLDLSPDDICYCLAIAQVKELMIKASANEKLIPTHHLE